MAGIYRVLVIAFRGDEDDSLCTVRVYANGGLAGEFSAALVESNSIWTVADIEWFDSAPPVITDIGTVD